MPNTYTQIYIQFVFAVRGRKNLVSAEKREPLQKYITGIIKNNGQKLISMYANPDHIHVFIGYDNFNIRIPDLVRDIKASSSKMMNEEKWFAEKFHWQEGYGAFSYSKSQVDAVVKYIMNQEEHHRKKSFREEYISFLEHFGINYDNKYLFEFYDEQ